MRLYRGGGWHTLPTEVVAWCWPCSCVVSIFGIQTICSVTMLLRFWCRSFVVALLGCVDDDDDVVFRSIKFRPFSVRYSVVMFAVVNPFAFNAGNKTKISLPSLLPFVSTYVAFALVCPLATWFCVDCCWPPLLTLPALPTAALSPSSKGSVFGSTFVSACRISYSFSHWANEQEKTDFKLVLNWSKEEIFFVSLRHFFSFYFCLGFLNFALVA